MWQLKAEDLHAPIFFTISEETNKHLKRETNSYEYF